LCLQPDYSFRSQPEIEGGGEALVFAQHFLSQKFDAGQKQALTAALIADLTPLENTWRWICLAALILVLVRTLFLFMMMPYYYCMEGWKVFNITNSTIR
jgi:hypothetical protein